MRDNGRKFESIIAEIPDSAIPPADNAPYHHLHATYASEINKVLTVWNALDDAGARRGRRSRARRLR